MPSRRDLLNASVRATDPVPHPYTWARYLASASHHASTPGPAELSVPDEVRRDLEVRGSTSPCGRLVGERKGLLRPFGSGPRRSRPQKRAGRSGDVVSLERKPL